MHVYTNEAKPLILAWVVSDRAKRVLRKLKSDLLCTSSENALFELEGRRSPRLCVLEATCTDGNQCLSVIERLRREYPLTEIVVWMPQSSSEAIRQYFKAGVKDVLVSPSPDELAELIPELLSRQRLLPKLNELSTSRHRKSSFESMLSRSRPMWDLFELCMHTAQSGATVLIVGETGTGKELMARAIHRRSHRKGRFVVANCASMAEELINSELFGHEKGAFTGADRKKKGLVSHADGGTLFLDEIGDMPSAAQQSLLRLLQERKFRTVGGLHESESDARVIAATNVALDKAVHAGEFREDLFYRLDVIRMNIPPLRDRPEDILFLFGHFCKRLAEHYGLEPPTFADSFLDSMLQYSWPGNVRQLENFSERLILSRPRKALSDQDFAKLRKTSLTVEGREEEPLSQAAIGDPVDLTKPMQELVEQAVAKTEIRYLTEMLEKHEGRITETASRAGISRRTLLRKMNAYGLDKAAFKPDTSS